MAESVSQYQDFPLKCEPFILDIVLIIVDSDNFPQDAAAAATVSTMEAASVDGSIPSISEGDAAHYYKTKSPKNTLLVFSG